MFELFKKRKKRPYFMDLVLSRVPTTSCMSISKSCNEVSLSFHVYFSQAYFQLGINDKLGLSGRPDRPVGCLGTSKVVKEILIFL